MTPIILMLTVIDRPTRPPCCSAMRVASTTRSPPPLGGAGPNATGSANLVERRNAESDL